VTNEAAGGDSADVLKTVRSFFRARPFDVGLLHGPLRAWASDVQEMAQTAL